MRVSHTIPLLAVVLSGCATPIVAIDAPGFSPALSPAPAGEPKSMDESLQKLNHVRAKYYDAVRLQNEQNQNATTGLVWLGTAIAGLAAGKAHHDWILYPSLIGGTAYGLSRTQLDARRLQILSEGIKALDCAKLAAQPLRFDKAFLDNLSFQLAQLASQRSKVALSRNKLVAAATNPSLKPDEMQQAQEVMQKANQKTDQVLKASMNSAIAGSALLRASNGGLLSATVDRISQQVTEATNNIAVDISSVSQLVAGLGGFAAILAPGSGLKAQIDGIHIDKSHSTGDINDLAKLLDIDINSLVESATAVDAMTAQADATAVGTALKACGVTAPSGAMTLEPATLQVSAQTVAAKGVAIKGGTPPYVVTMLDAAPDGFTPVFAGGLANTFQVKTTDKVPAGEYRVLVSDSGQQNQSQQLIVTVASATPKPATPKDPQQPAKPSPKPPAPLPDAKASWVQFAADLQKSTAKYSVNNVSFGVVVATAMADGISVKISCAKPGLAIGAVRETLAKASPASERLKTLNALDKDLTKIDLSPSGTCVK